MSYTGEDVRRLAETYRQEIRKCEEVRRAMWAEFVQRVRAEINRREV